MNYGFIAPEKIETREEGAEHVLGAVTKIVNPSGSWLAFVPEGEAQARNSHETYACSIFNTLNAIETAIFYQTGIRVNYSDRALSNIAVYKGLLNPVGGSNPHEIAELIRNVSGLLADSKLPWDDDFYNVQEKDIISLIQQGQPWYKDWELRHEWIWINSPTPAEKRTLIQQALKQGTVCTSVFAWQEGPIDGIYIKPAGVRDGHWTSIVEAKDNEPYTIFDSYPQYIKKLDPLFDFSFAKVFYLTPRTMPYNFTRNLRFGTTDTEVSQLQKSLISLGYDIPHATSYYYGNETRSALWKFQVSVGIYNNMGEDFGPRTRFELNKALKPPTTVFGEMMMYISAYLGL